MLFIVVYIVLFILYFCIEKIRGFFILISLCSYCYVAIMSGCSHCKHNEITPFLYRYVYIVISLVRIRPKRVYSFI